MRVIIVVIVVSVEVVATWRGRLERGGEWEGGRHGQGWGVSEAGGDLEEGGTLGERDTWKGADSVRRIFARGETQRGGVMEWGGGILGRSVQDSEGGGLRRVWTWKKGGHLEGGRFGKGVLEREETQRRGVVEWGREVSVGVWVTWKREELGGVVT